MVGHEGGRWDVAAKDKAVYLQRVSDSDEPLFEDSLTPEEARALAGLLTKYADKAGESGGSGESGHGDASEKSRDEDKSDEDKSDEDKSGEDKSDGDESGDGDDEDKSGEDDESDKDE